MKRSIGLIIIGCLLLCSCSSKPPEYQWQLISEDEVVSIFQDQKETLQAITSILLSYENKFYPNSIAENDTKAWIGSPYDTEKMSYFSTDEQELIKEFMENTLPYMIVVCAEDHVSFDYTNEDQTGTYSIDYYADLHDFKLAINQDRKEIIEYTQDGWILRK